MKITDLRVGNILSFVLPNKFCQVDYLLPDLVGSSQLGLVSENFNAERPIEDFKPIELNQEWFLKFGFERKYFKDKPVFVCKHYMFLDFTYYIEIKESGFIAFNVFNCFLKQIKYVHEFQNLYFALTGDELLIS